jgi:hypothetical protein
MNLLKRAASSLLGHIVFFQAVFSLPLFLFFLSENHSQGTLTVESAIYLAALWSAFGAVGAAFFWYTMSLPLIRRRQGDQRSGGKRHGR